MNELPKTLDAAVAFALTNLSSDAREELANAGFVDPHTKYRTDFEKLVTEALCLGDGLNEPLLVDVAKNHGEKLHFLESDGQRAEPRAVLRVVLAEMVKAVRQG